MVEASAEAKTFCKAAARGPGVEAIGIWGAGDGDADCRESMVYGFQPLLIIVDKVSIV